MNDVAERDLDETRRLLYIALAVPIAGRKHAELVGTLVNALRHHSGLLNGAIMDDIARVSAVARGSETGRGAAVGWIAAINGAERRLRNAQADPAVAPAIPLSVTNALRMLEMLLDTFTDNTLHGALYYATFHRETVRHAQQVLETARAAVQERDAKR